MLVRNRKTISSLHACAWWFQAGVRLTTVPNWVRKYMRSWQASCGRVYVSFIFFLHISIYVSSYFSLSVLLSCFPFFYVKVFTITFILICYFSISIFISLLFQKILDHKTKVIQMTHHGFGACHLAWWAQLAGLIALCDMLGDLLTPTQRLDTTVLMEVLIVHYQLYHVLSQTLGQCKVQYIAIPILGNWSCTVHTWWALSKQIASPTLRFWQPACVSLYTPRGFSIVNSHLFFFYPTSFEKLVHLFLEQAELCPLACTQHP